MYIIFRKKIFLIKPITFNPPNQFYQTKSRETKSTENYSRDQKDGHRGSLQMMASKYSYNSTQTCKSEIERADIPPYKP